MAELLPCVWQGTGSYGFPRAARRTCSYNAYSPDALIGRDILLPPDVATDMNSAEQALTSFGENNRTVASLEAISRLLLRAEAISSSRIEGLEVGTRRLVRAEALRALNQPSHDVTAEAVLGNIEAMHLAVSDLAIRDQLTLDDLFRLHQALMRRTQIPEIGGQVRRTQNWIGGNNYNPCGADFVPPPPELVPALLNDLVAYLNTSEHPPLLQAALVHSQFEAIHPFADGNGRVGRALIHVVLRRRLPTLRFVPPISLILATHSRDYIRGLTGACYVGPADSPQAFAGIAEWLSIFFNATIRAARDAEDFDKRIELLVEQWRLKAAPVRARSSVDLLLRALPGAPIITVATAAKLIGRHIDSANEAVNRLAQVGVLIPTRNVQRFRTFEAQGLLDALTDFERSLASPTGNTHDVAPVRPVPRRYKHEIVT